MEDHEVPRYEGCHHFQVVMTDGCPWCLRTRCQTLAQETLDAAALHLADEQSLRNDHLQVDDLKAALALLKSELKERGERIDSANRLLSEEQKKADGLLAHLGALRAVLIIDGGEKLAPEIRKALWLDHDVALDLQRVRREVVEAAKELKTKERWPYLDVGGGRLARALDALEKVEAARVEKGLPLETRIIEKQETEKRFCECPTAGDAAIKGTDLCAECRRPVKRNDEAKQLCSAVTDGGHGYCAHYKPCPFHG